MDLIILFVISLLISAVLAMWLEWRTFKNNTHRKGRSNVIRAAFFASLPAVIILIALCIISIKIDNEKRIKANIEFFKQLININSSDVLSTGSNIDSLLEMLPKGSAIVTAPSEVLQYQGFDATLRLAKKKLAELIDDTESRAAPGATVKGITGVRMSPRMKAELVGEDFIIEDKGPQEQLVTLKKDTVWVWRVHSEMPGRRVLKARLHTLLKIDGQEAPRTIEVAEAEVVVKVNPSEWALRNWEWIASALMLPILGWVLKRLFDRNKA
jgi:hypothetical protein